MSERPRPRVALVVHDIAPFGGMDRALRELIEGASDRFQFVVVSRTVADELRDLVEWHPVRVPARPIPLKFALFFVLAGLRVARERVDLVCSEGAIVPNRLDLAFVQYCHAGFKRATGALAPAEVSFVRRVNTSILRLLSIAAERWCYRRSRARRLVPVSEGLAAELRQDYPGVPLTIVPNGVELERFAPDPEVRGRVRSELGVGSAEVVALFVGGDWERKGLGIAIEAVARAARHGIALRLWVVGEGDLRRYSEQAESLGVGDRVTFFGPQLETGRFYRAADLFVFPTAYEALPLVALEALASGLPLVVTLVNGVHELFREEEPGLLVDRRPESVSDALVRLASDPDLRRRLGAAGRGIAGQFTWQRTVEATVELFDAALSEKGLQERVLELAGERS